MIFPIIISLIALLLFVFIGYNMIKQYEEKLESEKRIVINRQRSVISEVDELLLSATKMPVSKALLLVLQHRSSNALAIMLQNSPDNAQMRQHLQNVKAQIKQTQTTYKEPSTVNFKIPTNEKEALVLLQITKKMRAVLRSEHAKGKINTQIFVKEDHRLEIMQLKINLENSIKRIQHALAEGNQGAASQMALKLIAILSKLPDKDAYLEEKLSNLMKIKVEISNNSEIKDAAKVAAKKERDKKEKDSDIDRLFQDKKKW